MRHESLSMVALTQLLFIVVWNTQVSLTKPIPVLKMAWSKCVFITIVTIALVTMEQFLLGTVLVFTCTSFHTYHFGIAIMVFVQNSQITTHWYSSLLRRSEYYSLLNLCNKREIKKMLLVNKIYILLQIKDPDFSL